ncbi:MAG: hypothetical protein JW934_12265, partial [Anaerolineae bacterium]|nr:hypothetical protein [Anaerolineae bacterium]
FQIAWSSNWPSGCFSWHKCSSPYKGGILMRIAEFSSLAQRIANGWAETIPDFVSVSSIPVSEASQRQFYVFLRGVAESVRDHPDWLDLPIQPDDAYEHGEMQNRRPELIRAMLNTKRKLDDFITLLLRMGLHGTVDGQMLCIRNDDLNLAAKTRARLARFGLALEIGKEETAITCDTFPDLFPAWVWMAAEATRTAPTTGKKGVPPVRFSHCLYSDIHPYSRDVLIRLAYDSPGLPVLVDFVEKEGYALVCNRANKVTADWVKSCGKADEPLKDSWAERTHGGFSIEYDWIRKNPLHLGLRIPEFKTLLQHFDAMPKQVRDFVVRHTKHCDNCGYCTQTDKTGKRKPAFLTVERNGTHDLCLMFPGFGYTWQQVDGSLALDIRAFLAFVDDTLTGNKGQK